jgi:hypothetical protein
VPVILIMGAPRWWTALRARVLTSLHARGRRWRERLPGMLASYGNDYPWAIRCRDERLPLRRVSRFARYYGAPELGQCASISRFHDGSATMPLARLRRWWPRWSPGDRIEFGNECSWLVDQPDFPDLLRFIAVHATAEEFEAIATWFTPRSRIPEDEAVQVLARRLAAATPGGGSNTAGAIGHLADQRAAPPLRDRLALLRSHPAYQADDAFVNWIAYEAIICAEGLQRLGHRDEVAETVVALLGHPCARVRAAAKRLQREGS